MAAAEPASPAPAQTETARLPVASDAPTNSGPVTAPIEPAKFQRAMFCSRRSGCRSISDACESEMNAPEAG